VDGCKRTGRFLKITAALLIACLLAARSPRRAEADLIAIIVIEAVEAALALLIEQKMASNAESVMESVAEMNFYEAMQVDQMARRRYLESALYSVDHGETFTQHGPMYFMYEVRYASRMKLNGALRSDGVLMRAEAGSLGGGKFDFNAPAWDGAGFGERHPGYRDVSGNKATIFSDIYDARTAQAESYASAMTESGFNAARWMYNSGDPWYDTAITRPVELHSYLMRSGQYTSGMDSFEEDYTNDMIGGYRQLLLLWNHIDINSAEQASEMGIETIRRADAAAEFELDAFQEKVDRAAAFEQASRPAGTPVLTGGF
jgi:hypothetical protein